MDSKRDDEWTGAWLENVSGSDVVGTAGVPACVPLRFDGDLVTFDERGGRARIGTTTQLSECVCIYRFYKSGYNPRPRREADQRTTTSAAAATTREQGAGSDSAGTAPPVAKRPRKGPAVGSSDAKAEPDIAKVPDSRDEDDDEEEEEGGEEADEEEEKEEEKAKAKEKEKKAKEEEDKDQEKEEEEEEETNGADKQKKKEKKKKKNEKGERRRRRAACKCSKTKAEGLMIQCDSCTSWYHAGCVGLSKAKAAQLKSWQCETCRSKGAVPAPLPLVEDDPRQWTLTKGTIISCLPEPTSGDRFWIAEVVHEKRKGQRTVQVRWFENDPKKRKLHYVQGAEQRLAVATIICPNVGDLLTKVGPDLFKLQDDPRLYTIT